MRQGSGDDHADSRSRPHPLSDEAHRAARWREVGADFVGRSAGNFRHPHSQSHAGKSRRRSHVPRGPSRARLHHGAHAAGLGHRRPQLAHECLFVFGAAGIFAVASRRSSFARPRQCALHSAALGASGVGTLFQSARAAHHRRKNGGRETRRHGSAPFEHGEHGRLLDAELSRDRSGGAAGDGDGHPRRESLRRRVREELDELGRTGSRWIFARRARVSKR